jgi:MYXO-CTERM domain-containing protein
MFRRVASALVIAAVLALGSREASADDPVDAASLSKELDSQIEALSLTDCAIACQSLGSMRTTADRICALDPGTRCAAAREKVQGATRRVESACPSCATAPGAVNERALKPAEAPPPAPQTLGATTSKSGRGCAACSIGSRETSSTGALALGLALAAWLGRRRARRHSN